MTAEHSRHAHRRYWEQLKGTPAPWLPDRPRLADSRRAPVPELRARRHPRAAADRRGPGVPHRRRPAPGAQRFELSRAIVDAVPERADRADAIGRLKRACKGKAYDKVKESKSGLGAWVSNRPGSVRRV